MSAVPPESVDAATAVFLRGGTVRDMLEAAQPWIRADERARIRSLLPYNVNCCDGFPAAVADMIGEHGE